MSLIDLVKGIKQGYIASGTNPINGIECPAGNSLKLGGKEASEYANNNPTMITSADDLCAQLENQTVPVITGQAVITAGIFTSNTRGSYISERSMTSKYGTLTFFGNGKIIQRYYNNGVWGEWTAQIDSSGGTINGNVTFRTDKEGTGIVLNLISLLRNVNMQITTDGSFIIHDATNRKTIVQANKDGTYIFNGTASGCLPLSGGTLTAPHNGPLTLNNTHETINSIITEFKVRGTTYGHIGFDGKDNAVVRTTNGTYNKILHTGNSNTVKIQSSAPTDTSALWVW